MIYTGSKNGSGVLEFIINHVPAHSRYFELFAGSASLFRRKAIASTNILNELDLNQFEKLEKMYAHSAESFLVLNEDAIQYLYNKPGVAWSRECFIYLDPPYPFSSRRSGKKLYNHEMSDKDHIKLLSSIGSIDANIMISTRQNDLYDRMLPGWIKKEFQTTDRGGVVNEQIFMNYDIDNLFLHQYDYAGHGYIDRQRIKRKITRFTNKLSQLPQIERHLFIQSLIKSDYTSVKHFMNNTNI